ncbi:MAG: cytochrome c maturation protein CcmE [Chloroherpetonaceae bacterium]|nr:cytochrome c maturation protein CcmE [Chloroherpetonaceae bacterium]MCS7211447.1 cytochrome c maturation protein CcmE [Chloroherpetonaceae bacterium]MDW8020022.1 cytochrome c maturation protein CcmE [Chloroherpetonaceae bacterium]
MLKNPKVIVGSGVVAAVLLWLAFTAQEWASSAIGYATLSEAAASKKVCYVKGYWVKEKPADLSGSVFTFYMRDESGAETRVVYRNGKPNNFEEATSIVVQGKYENGTLYAKDILVKCPSKYQSEAADKAKKI